MKIQLCITEINYILNTLKLNCNNISTILMYFWSNKCSLGEHAFQKHYKILTNPKLLNSSVYNHIHLKSLWIKYECPCYLVNNHVHWMDSTAQLRFKLIKTTKNKNFQPGLNFHSVHVSILHLYVIKNAIKIIVCKWLIKHKFDHWLLATTGAPQKWQETGLCDHDTFLSTNPHPPSQH